jgi:hypothetical protein
VIGFATAMLYLNKCATGLTKYSQLENIFHPDYRLLKVLSGHNVGRS